MVIYPTHILFASDARILTTKVVQVDSTSSHRVLVMIAGSALPSALLKVSSAMLLNALIAMPKRLSVEALFDRRMGRALAGDLSPTPAAPVLDGRSR